MGQRALRRALLCALLPLACSASSATSVEQATGPRPDGDPCQLNAQCQGGLCVPEVHEGQVTGWQDGMCSSLCPTGGCAEQSVCVTLTDANYCLPGCAEGSADCREGYVCHAQVGACLPDCRKGWDCGVDFVCDADSGLCQAPGDPGGPGDGGPSDGVPSDGLAFGAPCASHLECASAFCLLELDGETPTGWNDGMCSGPCAADGSCGEEGTCVRLDDYLLCVPRCGDTEPCRDGYACNDVLGGCLPDCRLGWDCGEGFECSTDDGSCQLGTAEAAPIGAACAHDYDCASGICFAANDDDGPTGWTAGSCVGICGSSACGPTTGCAVLEGNAWCLPSCDQTTPCRTGYVCSRDLQVCLPDCRADWDCSDDLVCGDDGRCEPGWVGLAPLGASCASHAECASGVCLLQDPRTGASWPYGICTLSCSDDCSLDTTCTSLGELAYCLPNCEGSQADCPTGYLCDGTYHTCLPDCRLGWSCPSGTSCSASGQCQQQGGGAGPGPGGRRF